MPQRTNNGKEELYAERAKVNELEAKLAEMEEKKEAHLGIIGNLRKRNQHQRRQLADLAKRVEVLTLEGATRGVVDKMVDQKLKHVLDSFDQRSCSVMAGVCKATADLHRAHDTIKEMLNAALRERFEIVLCYEGSDPKRSTGTKLVPRREVF